MTTGATTIGLLWRGDATSPPPRAEETRFAAIFERFEARGAHAVPVVYGDGIAQAVRARLLELDGVLVWVDPIVRGEDRSIWDADFLLGPRTPDGEDTGLLCEVNVSGVFPIPDESIPPLVDAAMERARIARGVRTR